MSDDNGIMSWIDTLLVAVVLGGGIFMLVAMLKGCHLG